MNSINTYTTEQLTEFIQQAQIELTRRKEIDHIELKRLGKEFEMKNMLDSILVKEQQSKELEKSIINNIDKFVQSIDTITTSKNIINETKVAIKSIYISFDRDESNSFEMCKIDNIIYVSPLDKLEIEFYNMANQSNIDSELNDYDKIYILENQVKGLFRIINILKEHISDIEEDIFGSTFLDNIIKYQQIVTDIKHLKKQI